MYESYFGFTEKPFNVTPDSRFLFESEKHREALAHMIYGIKERKGFITITGEIGTGKTLLCRALLSQLDKNVHTALILNPDLSKLELLQSILDDLEIPSNSTKTRKDIIDALNTFLLEESAKGKNVAVLIDEAQNLSPDVLEQVRLLSNLETENEKLIQLVLIGQPELNDILDLPNLRQLKQRIAVRYHITPLNYEEVCSYIEHRLGVAGGKHLVDFTPKARKRIYKFTNGVPRVINILCDQALLTAYVSETRKIDIKIINNAIKEIDGNSLPQKSGKYFKRISPHFSLVSLLNYVLLLFLIVLIGFFIRFSLPILSRLSGVTSPLIKTEQTGMRLPDRYLAFKRLAERYEINLYSLESLLEKQPDINLWKLSKYYGLDLVVVHSNLTKLKEYNFPAMLDIIPTKELKSRYIVLEKLNNDIAEVFDPLTGTHKLSRDDLDQLWYGTGYLLFPSRADIYSFLNNGSDGDGVLLIQKQLNKLGFPTGTPDGIFGTETEEALMAFQKVHGLKSDGVVGFETRVALFRSIYGNRLPSLE